MSRLICHFIRSNKDELYIFKIFFKSFTPDKRQCTCVTSFSERDGQSDCKLAVTRLELGTIFLNRSSLVVL